MCEGPPLEGSQSACSLKEASKQAACEDPPPGGSQSAYVFRESSKQVACEDPPAEGSQSGCAHREASSRWHVEILQQKVGSLLELVYVEGEAKCGLWASAPTYK